MENTISLLTEEGGEWVHPALKESGFPNPGCFMKEHAAIDISGIVDRSNDTVHVDIYNMTGNTDSLLYLLTVVVSQLLNDANRDNNFTDEQIILSYAEEYLIPIFTAMNNGTSVSLDIAEIMKQIDEEDLDFEN